VIHNHRIGDHQIERAVRGSRGRGLAQAVANDFATAEFGFLTGRRKILFNFDEQFGISQADSVARRRSVQIRILPSRNFQTHEEDLDLAGSKSPTRQSALATARRARTRSKTVFRGAFQRARLGGLIRQAVCQAEHDCRPILHGH
jgi:hypothetical protein